MDCLTFISELIRSLAWPVATFGIALLFRSQIRALLKRIKRGNWGGMEVEFAEDVERISEEAGVELVALDEISESNTNRFIREADPEMRPVLELAQGDPRGAVLAAWTSVDAAMRRLAAAKGVEPSGAMRLMRELAEGGHIRKEDAEQFNELRKLRNSAMHDGTFNPSFESVARYAELTSRLAGHFERLARGPME
ncbi:hypothetical protein LVB87_11540 [Lysobacter sp. KIS68-7]|uniref:hypothetical protein n=1 Tax=Lysobacter sp. KIS68-7 TaxID=2904252 RepID=UPI001E4EDB32|nr:hypothetical protein [Lysobacter sp. KIS68-7]UHQ18814.1 hypothetical protein LVB87_11540 [Lysobacter sp. KIS68-7]